MEMQEKIGIRITQLRKARKLSQQKFAYEADLERSFLTNIEKGRKNISVSTLHKVTAALKVSFKEFFSTPEFEEL